MDSNGPVLSPTPIFIPFVVWALLPTTLDSKRGKSRILLCYVGPCITTRTTITALTDLDMFDCQPSLAYFTAEKGMLGNI